jgi:putative tricarboxylic transport membrane protein
MTDSSSDNRVRRPDRAASVIGVVLGLAGVAMIANTYGAVETISQDPIGPKGYPYILGAALIGLALWTIIEAWRGDFPEREPQNLPPIVWILGGLAAQLLLLHAVGFSIATGILFAATAYAFGQRRLHITIPIGIIFAYIVWVVFAQGLGLGLPAGPLERLFF